MDLEQTRYTIERLFGIEDTCYWAPESIICKLHLIVGDNDMVDVIAVLYQNADAFKNRIDGRIDNNNWISKETFGPIAAQCAAILRDLPGKAPWQTTLMERFDDMIDIV